MGIRSKYGILTSDQCLSAGLKLDIELQVLQDSAEALGQNPGLNAVLNDLLGLFGDIGTYGVLFKLAGFIKGRVEQMQDVEGNAKKVEKQAMYILKSFEKVEIRFTISNDVILEEAAQTFCHCAAVLQRIYQHDQSCQW